MSSSAARSTRRSQRGRPLPAPSPAPTAEPRRPAGRRPCRLYVGGREVWLLDQGRRLRGGNRHAFTDATEDRRLEQLKADFIATVSHELRTPLRGRPRRCEDVAARGRPRRNRGVRKPAHAHLRAVRPSRRDGRGHPAREPNRLPELDIATGRVNVAALAADVLAAARAHAGDRLQLELVAPPSLPPVAADGDRLRQVLTNLVTNAVKYSPAGSHPDRPAGP